MKVLRRLIPVLGMSAVLLMGAGGFESYRHLHGADQRRATSEASETREQPRPVCLGYVDVEPGVAALVPLQAGRVASVLVQEGQTVTAGTVLVHLDSEPAECLVRLARADLEAALVQASQAKKAVPQQALKEAQQLALIDGVRARLKAAEEMLARKAELRGVYVNAKEYAAAEAQADEVRATLRGEENKLAELRLNDPADTLRKADAEVVAKQARLDQTLLGVKECDIRAPENGAVLRLLVAPGDVLGSQMRRPAVMFCPARPRIVRAEVEQEFAPYIALGQEATIQDDNTASAVWHGKVVRVSDWFTHRRSLVLEPLQMNDVRTLECLIELDAGQQQPRIGQRVRVMFGPAPR